LGIQFHLSVNGQTWPEPTQFQWNRLDRHHIIHYQFLETSKNTSGGSVSLTGLDHYPILRPFVMLILTEALKIPINFMGFEP